MKLEAGKVLGVSRARATLLALLCTYPLTATMAAETPGSNPQVQFGGECAEGLAQSQHVATNCAITWTDKDGKVYCFSSESSKKTFLQDPNGNLQKAHEFVAAASVEATEKAMQNYTSSDAEALVRKNIEEKTKANSGVFPLDDPLNGEQLKLVFDDVDFTRTIDGYGFFPDVKFHDQADASKHYLIDFWVVPDNGQLKIQVPSVLTGSL